MTPRGRSSRRETIERTINAAAEAGAAIAALPARDTVKLADTTETRWVGAEFGEPLPAVTPKRGSGRETDAAARRGVSGADAAGLPP